MDALKFAFEILIVGALALPWLAILIRMFSPGPAAGTPVDSLRVFLSVVPQHTRDAVAAVLMVAMGYLLGSAVSRISRNFFNDELWGGLPTENQIRDGVYHDEYCAASLLSDLHLPEFKEHPRMPDWLCAQSSQNVVRKPVVLLSGNVGAKAFKAWTSRGHKPASFDGLVQEMFRLQEGKLLLNGQDKVDRLKQYYDQITVLRGAALNGVILFALCAFGFFGNWKARLAGSPILNVRTFFKALTFLPAVGLACYGAISLWRHWYGKADSRYSDPPLAELVLVLLGVIGIFVILKAKHATYYVPTCAVAAVLTVVSFGGWWWTEVMYDLHVIHSVPELQTFDATAQAIAEAP